MHLPALLEQHEDAEPQYQKRHADEQDECQRSRQMLFRLAFLSRHASNLTNEPERIKSAKFSTFSQGGWDGDGKLWSDEYAARTPYRRVPLRAGARVSLGNALGGGRAATGRAAPAYGAASI